MSANVDHQPMLSQEYPDWEDQQPHKHEYLNGEAYAMTGGTLSLSHNAIAVNLTTALRTYLRGKGCRVFMADAKVGVTESGPFFYPDVLVTCDDRDRRALKIVQHPCLIVEVLSPGTEGFDRGEKFKHYRRLSSLKEYVLLNAATMSVECYRLNERNKWELTVYSLEDSAVAADALEIELTSVNFRCLLTLIYEDVELSLEELPE